MKAELYDGLDINWSLLNPLLEERQAWPSRPQEKSFAQALAEDQLPHSAHFQVDQGLIEIGQANELSADQHLELERLARLLIPWKKGPFRLFGLEIDGEWRSDYKWDHLLTHLPSMKGKRVLDIGCNNGYFMFRMLEHNPALVLGIDPVVRTMAQFEFVRRRGHFPQLDYALLGMEHVQAFKSCFDLIFSMGIIYHHPNPIEQLIHIREALVPGGSVVLETLGIAGDSSHALFPEGRYAKMRNIWFIPTLNCLANWARKARFEKVELLYSYPLTTDEQRHTLWCNEGGQSLEDFLDPLNRELTIEGHPAPYRMSILATKKGGG